MLQIIILVLKIICLQINFRKLDLFWSGGLIHSLEGDKCINSPCIKNSWDKYLYFLFENNLTSKDIVFSWARDKNS